MATVCSWNDKVWRRSVPVLAQKYKVTLAQILNQFALDTVGNAFDRIPPGDYDTKRLFIKLLLTDQLSTRVRRYAHGKRRGEYHKTGARNKQLQRVHLLANYYRAKYGRPGLYGKNMLRYAGAMKQRRQVGVGSVKSVFLPMIRALNPLVKFKFPFAKTSKISRWPGSRGYGIAKPAQESWSPKAILQLRYTARFHQEAKLQRMYDQAVDAALAWKKSKMIRDAQRFLDPVNQQFNLAQK